MELETSITYFDNIIKAAYKRSTYKMHNLEEIAWFFEKKSILMCGKRHWFIILKTMLKSIGLEELPEREKQTKSLHSYFQREKAISSAFNHLIVLYNDENFRKVMMNTRDNDYWESILNNLCGGRGIRINHLESIRHSIILFKVESTITSEINENISV